MGTCPSPSGCSIEESSGKFLKYRFLYAFQRQLLRRTNLDTTFLLLYSNLNYFPSNTIIREEQVSGARRRWHDREAFVPRILAEGSVVYSAALEYGSNALCPVTIFFLSITIFPPQLVETFEGSSHYNSKYQYIVFFGIKY